MGARMKIAVAGCLGRMGLTLVEATLADPRFTLVCGSARTGYDRNRAERVLTAAGARALRILSDPAALAKSADAVIDFTTPEASLAVAKAVAKTGGIHIIGTTGWTAAQQKSLARYAKTARIVQSGNFSLGVAVLEKLVEDAARLLDDHYDIEIFEMHHRHKKDAPSGTALMLGRAAARGRKIGFIFPSPQGREDQGGGRPLRKTGEIGFSVARGGDVVGIHEVTLAGPGELISLKHQGFSRQIYAQGALKAALWARKQKPGLYSMRDVMA